MTARSLNAPPVLPNWPINWAFVGIVIAVMVHYTVAVSFASRVEARVHKLEEVTEPIRRGDLVQIQTDVRWIREQYERDRSR